MDIHLTEEEVVVDQVKGYPPGYGRLSRLAAQHTGSETFGCHRSPPYGWVPAEDPDITAAASKFQQSFPMIPESQRDRKSVIGFESTLWSRLRPCLEFNPDLLRVDKFGNVIYRRAPTNTILAGCVDHYFPVASKCNFELHVVVSLHILGCCNNVYYQFQSRKFDVLFSFLPQEVA